MDFRQIEAFIQVVKCKSFSKAAEAIFLTQPTISAHISTLENELGTKLVDRSGKDIVPTKAGGLFYGYCVNMVNTRDNAIYKLNEFNHRVSGKIDIYSSTIPAQYIIPEYMTSFSKEYNDVSFSITQLDSKQVLDAIMTRNIELGFVGTKSDNDKLEFIKIADDDLMVITPNIKKFHQIANHKISVDDIIQENFIIREAGSGTRTEFEAAIKRAGHNPKSLKVIAQMTSIEAIKQAVNIGLGISVASSIGIEDYVKFGLVKAFYLEEIEMKRAFYMVYHKNRPLSPLIANFLEYVQNYNN